MYVMHLINLERERGGGASAPGSAPEQVNDNDDHDHISVNSLHQAGGRTIVTGELTF
jgi:hypothetical protein